MAKKRLIPKLQLMPSRLSSGRLSLVTTVGFDRTIEVGDPVSQAKIYEAQDGSRSGLEPDITRQVCAAVRIPVIVSGGCGRAAHFVEVFREAGADAVAAGTFFCFQDQNPMQTRGHVKNAGFEIRNHT
jgi:imidazole glycerol phosphate synthase subunit HisF